MTTLRDISNAEQREAYLAQRQRYFDEVLGLIQAEVRKLERRQKFVRYALVFVWVVFVLALVATFIVNL